MVKNLVALMWLTWVSVTASANQDPMKYGDLLVDLPTELSKLLAMKDAPNHHGAMGRNKSQYIHVRFQLGLHNLAYYALASQDVKALEYFIKAVAYSFEHQLSTGGFELKVPDALRKIGVPDEADLVSGVAFFVASLGTGWLALESNEWFQNSDELVTVRARLRAHKSELNPTLVYLKNNLSKLEYADRKAPNRLLFDALAFYTMGHILCDEAAKNTATQLINQALAQVDDAGYFIEGGGFDSSYNGVATALVFRLLLMGYDDPKLKKIGLNALQWQLTRIDEQGKVTTTGNTRVNPDNGGESFMGRTKDVDVGHTLEALMLAYVFTRDASYLDSARLVINHYTNQ